MFRAVDVASIERIQNIVEVGRDDRLNYNQ